MDGWLASKQHRDHILAKNFGDTGSAVVFGKNASGWQVLWVQAFGRPRDLLPAQRNRLQNPGKT